MTAYIAVQLGWERPEDAEEDPADPTESFPPQFVVAGRSNMPKPILDFDALRAKNEEAVARVSRKNRERLAKSG